MSPARSRGGDVLAAFNSVAQYKRLHMILCLMLEEIVDLVESGRSEGLQAKAQAAIPLWVEWWEFHSAHRNGGKPVTEPRAAETDLVLNAAALGCEPTDILREVVRLRQDLAKNPASLLDHFNDYAEFKVMATEMWLRIEEICLAIDGDRGEGLQEKCEVAILFWQLWGEWLRAHSDQTGQAEDEQRSDPLRAQIDLLLNAGILGWQPAEIQRRLQRLREENGWAPMSLIEAANVHGAEDALYVWRN